MIEQFIIEYEVYIGVITAFLATTFLLWYNVRVLEEDLGIALVLLSSGTGALCGLLWPIFYGLLILASPAVFILLLIKWSED